jgi:hypothetical protein
MNAHVRGHVVIVATIIVVDDAAATTTTTTAAAAAAAAAAATGRQRAWTDNIAGGRGRHIGGFSCNFRREGVARFRF